MARNAIGDPYEKKTYVLHEIILRNPTDPEKTVRKYIASFSSKKKAWEYLTQENSYIKWIHMDREKEIGSYSAFCAVIRDTMFKSTWAGIGFFRKEFELTEDHLK